MKHKCNAMSLRTGVPLMTKGSKSKITHEKHAFQFLFLNVWYETWRRLETTVAVENRWRKHIQQ